MMIRKLVKGSCSKDGGGCSKGGGRCLKGGGGSLKDGGGIKEISYLKRIEKNRGV